MRTLLTMSKQELSRLEVVQNIAEKRLSQVQGAVILDISARQIHRLLKAYKRYGPEGLVSKHRGKPSNNRLPDDIAQTAIRIIRDQYYDFGPTLAAEKLLENHCLPLSVETVRKLMIEAGLWKTRAQRLKRAYQPRYRRDCYGELVQIDGSDHAWFEDRAPKCTLLVYIDDATSHLMALRFVQTESTFTYFEVTKQYLLEHGKPVAYYSDKHSVFRTNKKGELGGDGITQFGRAMQDLNIDIICANTCQAKGRVERANKTLQDRLVKELRLQKISTIEAANAFLPAFIEDHNRRFGKAPLNENNVHRPLQPHEDIDEIFCWQEERTLSKNLTLQYNKVIYLIEDSVKTRKLIRKRVMVHDFHDGRIKIKYQGKVLPYSIFDRLQKVDQGKITDNKRLGGVLSFIKEKQDQRDEQRSTSCPSRRHLGHDSTTKLRASTVVHRS